MSLKSLALRTSRMLGLFALAQWITRKQLRILCYHGFSVGDEYKYMPMMFMRSATFERRMGVLKKRRLEVVSLSEGVHRLNNASLTRAATVITLDDGWASNLSIGLPILQRYGYPACIYVTSEHLGSNPHVFNVAFHYMLLSTTVESLVLSGIHPALDGVYDFRADLIKVIKNVVGKVEEHFSFGERIAVLRKIAPSLGFRLDDVLQGDRFRLMTDDELRAIYRSGIDIQLHTHSHRLPKNDFDTMAREISHNRAAIKNAIGETKDHFCYPSGEYSREHPEWLEQLGIASATTCDSGFNRVGSQAMLLKRSLDSDEFSDLEFEAEVSGFKELIRIIRSTFGRGAQHATTSESSPTTA